jgi:hypothetical protein
VRNPDKHRPDVLDKCVAALRYHISALPGRCYDELGPLLGACWELLDTSGGVGERTVCPAMIHCVVSVLLVELFAKVPPACHAGTDRSLPFPGRCGLEPECFSARLEVGGAGWTSTGAFLLPGVLATVCLSHAVEGAWLQAGSHPCALASRSGPWNRLPAVTVRVPLGAASADICSPCGGILYVTCDADQPIVVDARFYRVGRHPLYARGAPDAWLETRDCAAPWGELETLFAIFTAPTAFLRGLENVEEVCAALDALIASVLAFMCDDRTAPYRVVFDVEVSPAARRNFYPIIVPVEHAAAIFAPRTLCEPLVQFLHHIAFRSCPPASMPTNAREALASLAAYAVAVAAWPAQEAEVRALIRSPSPLFPQFLKIYLESDKKQFLAAIAAVRPRLSSSGGKGHITYGFFVKKLAQGCGKALTQTLLDESVTATRPDIGYELGAAENLEEYRIEPPAAVAAG